MSIVRSGPSRCLNSPCFPPRGQRIDDVHPLLRCRVDRVAEMPQSKQDLVRVEPVIEAYLEIVFAPPALQIVQDADGPAID